MSLAFRDLSPAQQELYSFSDFNREFGVVYADEDECAAALEKLRAETHAKNAAMLHAMAQDKDTTRDLPSAFGMNAADAKPQTAYYDYARRNEPDTSVYKFRPQRVVRAASGNKSGFTFTTCCQHGVGAEACTHQAVPHAFGQPARFCVQHGAKCPCGHTLQSCMQCNDNLGKKMHVCSKCCSTQIGTTRRVSNGGCGLCLKCEKLEAAEKAAEAAARQGKPPPPSVPVKRTKEHELKMLERLVLRGYVESFDKGVAPRPGQFVREPHIDLQCTFGKAAEKQFARVDFVVNPPSGGGLVFLEIDEHEHKYYNDSVLCDVSRMWNVCTSLKDSGFGEVSVFWLRVNPNTSFDIGDGTRIKYADFTNTQRCDAVVAFLDDFEFCETDARVRAGYAFYQMHADCTPRVVDDPTYPEVMRAQVHRLVHAFDPKKSGSCELLFRGTTKKRKRAD